MTIPAGKRQEKNLKKLESRAAGPIELPQRRNVRAVRRTDAPCIYRQTQILRLLNAQPSIVQLSETITFRGNQSITARKIHRTRRPVRAPALSCNCGEIVPVPSIPHIPPKAPGPSAPVTVLDAGIALSVTRISQNTAATRDSFGGELLRLRVEQIVTLLSFESRSENLVYR